MAAILSASKTAGARPIMKRVTVIMRTRNRPMFLRRAVASVKAQTWTDWQIVVVNDGGDAAEVDTVVAEAGVAAEALQVIHHAVPVGRAAACNAAIRVSESEFLTVLDDDDTWHPEFLRQCMAVLGQLPADAVQRGVATRTLLINESWVDGGCREKKRVPFNPDLVTVSLADLAVENYYTTNAFLYRRNVLPETGFYDETLPVLEDWEFNVRFAAKFSILVIPEYLAFYHRRLRLKEGAAANTCMDRNQRQMVELKNAWLRDDLAAGRFGIGWLAHLGKTRSEQRRARALNRIMAFGRRWFL
jgi:glycosyltransferase involved in cell wall biosynthesis